MLINSTNIHVTNPLPYLFVGYTIFWLVVFAYVISLSMRQRRADAELKLIQEALAEETRRRTTTQAPGTGHA